MVFCSISANCLLIFSEAYNCFFHLQIISILRINYCSLSLIRARVNSLMIFTASFLRLLLYFCLHFYSQTSFIYRFDLGISWFSKTPTFLAAWSLFILFMHFCYNFRQTPFTTVSILTIETLFLMVSKLYFRIGYTLIDSVLLR